MVRNFLIGTDWWTDCDDAVAIRLAARAHTDKTICIKGIGINACMQYSASSLKNFLVAHGLSDIPMGIDHDATDYGGRPPYQRRLSMLSDHPLSNFDLPDAAALYRKILSESEGKVEIVEIGFPQILSKLLDSHPDGFSDKNGIELVKEKVSKIWMMAGKWDEPNGREHNFEKSPRSRKAAAAFCEKCPVEVTFLGWEVGYNVISAGNLSKDDILYKVLCDHGSSGGRSSWDPMLMLMAVIGDEEKAGYDVVCGRAEVCQESGENNFYQGKGLHKYVVKKHGSEYYQKAINERIRSSE